MKYLTAIEAKFSCPQFILRHRQPIIVCLVFIFATLTAFEFYLHRTLKGDINNHILSSEMFGVPDALQKKGIQALYGAGQTGWDGQFYYYISNDLLGLKDTPKHIDAPSYRYQRVGFSLYAATVAVLTGQDWVSPRIFFLSYFVLVLAATWFGAQLLAKLNQPPALILLWSLWGGTQITLFNALPDAAADAFLILALAAAFAGRYGLATIPFILSVLSREVYVLFPLCIAAIHAGDKVAPLWRQGADRLTIATAFLRWHSWYWLALPVVMLVAWQVYLSVHFGIVPSAQAHGILGAPFAAVYKYVSRGLLGTHSVVRDPVWARVEAVSLLLFLAILVTSGTIAWRILRRYSATPLVRGIAATTLALAVMYACFGNTVIMHYTGYLKAAAVFVILIPLLLSEPVVDHTFRNWSIGLLCLMLGITSYYNLHTRILHRSQNFDSYTEMSSINNKDNIACIGAYSADISVRDIELNVKTSFFDKLFGAKDYVVINTTLKNTGEKPFVSTRGNGSVHVSCRWLDQNGAVIGEGARSAIVTPLLPGETREIKIVSRIPSAKGAHTLRLSPVQEGCTWFYEANQAAAADLKFHFR